MFGHNMVESIVILIAWWRTHRSRHSQTYTSILAVSRRSCQLQKRRLQISIQIRIFEQSVVYIPPVLFLFYNTTCTILGVRSLYWCILSKYGASSKGRGINVTRFAAGNKHTWFLDSESSWKASVLMSNCLCLMLHITFLVIISEETNILLF